MVYRPRYPWHFYALSMEYRPSTHGILTHLYPWYFEPPNHGILTPIHDISTPHSWYIESPYPWYIDHVTHEILTPYPWYIDPPPMVYRPLSMLF
jgi:hypothetical protein